MNCIYDWRSVSLNIVIKFSKYNAWHTAHQNKLIMLSYDNNKYSCLSHLLLQFRF